MPSKTRAGKDNGPLSCGTAGGQLVSFAFHGASYETRRRAARRNRSPGSDKLVANQDKPMLISVTMMLEVRTIECEYCPWMVEQQAREVPWLF